jgi:type I restriction enzyme M protein
MWIYDPCAGSAGMLVHAYGHVREHGSDPDTLALCGQKANGSVWAMSKMNMILHGIRTRSCTTTFFHLRATAMS